MTRRPSYKTPRARARSPKNTLNERSNTGPRCGHPAAALLSTYITIDTILITGRAKNQTAGNSNEPLNETCLRRRRDRAVVISKCPWDTESDTRSLCADILTASFAQCVHSARCVVVYLRVRGGPRNSFYKRRAEIQYAGWWLFIYYPFVFFFVQISRAQVRSRARAVFFERFALRSFDGIEYIGVNAIRFAVRRNGHSCASVLIVVGDSKVCARCRYLMVEREIKEIELVYYQFRNIASETRVYHCISGSEPTSTNR